MNNTHYYDVDLNWEKDRMGVMSSPVLNNDIEVATPPEFPKGMAGIWSPEHLLVAAVNSCLMTTFLAVAENSKLNFSSFTTRATGKLEKTPEGYMITEVILYPKLAIEKEEDRQRAERILQKSEAACLISNSIKGKVMMEPVIYLLAISSTPVQSAGAPESMY